MKDRAMILQSILNFHLKVLDVLVVQGCPLPDAALKMLVRYMSQRMCYQRITHMIWHRIEQEEVAVATGISLSRLYSNDEVILIHVAISPQKSKVLHKQSMIPYDICLSNPIDC